MNRGANYASHIQAEQQTVNKAGAKESSRKFEAKTQCLIPILQLQSFKKVNTVLCRMEINCLYGKLANIFTAQSVHTSAKIIKQPKTQNNAKWQSTAE